MNINENIRNKRKIVKTKGVYMQIQPHLSCLLSYTTSLGTNFISCIFPPKGLTEMTQHLALSQFIITEVSSDQISHLF